MNVTTLMLFVFLRYAYRPTTYTLLLSEILQISRTLHNS